MNHDDWLIVSSVLGVFLVMGLGAFSRQRRWLSREADRSLANLTANVLLPALFFDRVLRGNQVDAIDLPWLPPLYGFAITSIGFLLALSLARRFGSWFGLDNDASQRSFALCAGICNYGYIPLPLAEIFYPAAQVELILHNVGVDMALWSVGILVVTGRESHRTPVHRWKRVLLSPPLVAVVIGLAFKRLGGNDWMPDSVTKSIGWLSSCAIPMGLLLSGAIIIDFLREATWQGAWRTMVAAIGFRQVLMPLLVLTVATYGATSTDIKQVLMLQAAMPSAVFPIVLVRLYDRDTGTALRVVLSTSLAGLVLIPLWIAAGSWWLGITSG